MIQDNFGKLYVGVSEDPEHRLKDHNTHRGSVFTKRGDFKIVFKEEHESLSEARRREIQIKKWRRDKKEFLVKRYQQGLTTRVQ
jgi:putative endonuclease